MGAWVLALAAVVGAAESESPLARAGIEITEVDAVEPLEAAVLVDELARAIERVAHAEAIVVGSPAAPCPMGSPRCARVIPDLVEARVTVRIFGGLSMVRIDAVASGGRITTTRGSVDVARDGELARTGLGELARALFPERLVAIVAPARLSPDRTAEASTDAPPPPEASGDLGWLIFGGSSAVVLGAVGIVFGLSSVSARSDAETPGVEGVRFEELADRAQAHGWAANAFFLTAAVGLATGVILYAVEP